MVYRLWPATPGPPSGWPRGQLEWRVYTEDILAANRLDLIAAGLEMLGLVLLLIITRRITAGQESRTLRAEVLSRSAE